MAATRDLGNSPRTILEELERIQSHDVVLPTGTHRQIRLHCVTQRDTAQSILLDRLGLVLPKRTRLPEATPSMLVATLNRGVDSAQVGLGITWKVGAALAAVAAVIYTVGNKA